jgi:hypothetical protein
MNREDDWRWGKNVVRCNHFIRNLEEASSLVARSSRGAGEFDVASFGGRIF